MLPRVHMRFTMVSQKLEMEIVFILSLIFFMQLTGEGDKFTWQKNETFA